MAEALLGAKALERTIKDIARHDIGSVTRAGLIGMATPIKKQIRKTVNATAAPASVKRAVRKSIGSTVKKVRGEYELKVGFSVGKKRKARRKRTRMDPQGRTAQGAAVGRKAGVGITEANIHWAIMGTGIYSTKTGQHRARKSTGASTGSSRPHFEGVIDRSVRAVTPEAVKKAAEKAKIALQKAAVKRSRRGKRSYSVPGGKA